MANQSIFTKIINGTLPSHKIYEDENTLAFLDIYPVVDGQMVVVPKKQVEFVWDLEDSDYQALMSTTKKVALKAREVFGTEYVGTKIEGVDVPHAHVKIYPFNKVSEFDAKQDLSKEPDHQKLAKIADKLKLESF